jgi:hypothetical protein
MNVDADHADAGLTLLRGNNALRVYDGALPGSVATVVRPYVLVYTTVEWPAGEETNSLDGLSGTCITSWICHCVGDNATAARAVANQVRAALLDVVPVIAGRECGPIRQGSVLPPQRDETLGTPVMDAIVVYELLTRPG